MDARSQALQALSQFLVSECSIQETLDQVAAISTAALPAAAFAGIAMLNESGKPATTVFTDTDAPEVDEAQYRSGRGPCLDAWRTSEVVTISDMDSGETTYPEFAEVCRRHGVQSVLSLPLVAGQRGIGAFNLYARTAHAFGDDDVALGTDLATAASVVLANASSYWAAYDRSEQLSEAMRSRAVIEQAKGMLMSRSPDLTADEAFDMLSSASQRENVKLRDIAQRIVDRLPAR